MTNSLPFIEGEGWGGVAETAAHANPLPASPFHGKGEVRDRILA